MMNQPIGVQIVCDKNTNLTEKFEAAREMEIYTCQICIWDETLYTEEYAARLLAAAEQAGCRITTVWGGWGGPCEWNFQYGPSTIGLVPPAYRESRIRALKRASDFAAWLGVSRVVTHVGFIPECPDDPNFAGTVAALRSIVKYMKAKEQYFLFEAGQETPVTLLRTIQAIGMENVGINLDTANLILYGKASTLDALDVFGSYVMEVHVKDGEYPTDGLSLGREKPAGQGKGRIREVVKRLKELGFSGTFTIEREIKGEQQRKDILMARDLLRQWLQE